MSDCDCIPEEHEHCVECDMPVFPSRVMWLERQGRKWVYGDKPNALPFGPKCGAKAMERTR